MMLTELLFRPNAIAIARLEIGSLRKFNRSLWCNKRTNDETLSIGLANCCLNSRWSVDPVRPAATVVYTRICAAEMAVRYAALSACRKVHP